MAKAILIPGSSGFIGTHFIKNFPELNIVEVDLLTQNVDEIDFSGIDSVLHLAALVHQMKGAPEEQYFKINRDLAYNVAKRAKEQGVKHFLLMSTAKVFGESTTGTPPWDENSECYPQDAYGKSKYEAEKLIKSLADNNFKVAIVRSPLVYGVGVKANMYNLVKLVDCFKVLPLGGIQNRRSMVFVGNLVALLQHIIDNQAAGVFIAGDQSSLSTTELTWLIGKSLKKRLILVKIPYFIVWALSRIKPSIVDRLFGSLELDNSNTNEKLGFVPPFSTEEGINKMVEWFKYQKGKS
jgi:nucleoside-diphosphate-sugar epimerase